MRTLNAVCFNTAKTYMVPDAHVPSKVQLAIKNSIADAGGNSPLVTMRDSKSEPMLGTVIELFGRRGEEFKVELLACEGGCIFTTSLEPTGEMPKLLIGISGIAWTESGADLIWQMLDHRYLHSSEWMLEKGIRRKTEFEYPELPEALPWFASVLLPDGFTAIDSSTFDDLRSYEIAVAHTVLAHFKSTEG